VVLGAVLATLFAAAEASLLRVEFRRQAYSFSMTGIPLVLGVLLVDARTVLAARLVGALAAFAVQRPRALKTAYNLCAYLLETALVAGGVHLALAGSPRALDLAAAVRVYAVVAVVDLAMSGLVLAVIRVHQGRLTGREQAGVLVPAVALSAVTTFVAVCGAVLASAGPLGWTLLALAVPAMLVVHRAYALLHGRHQALQVVHHFVAAGGVTPAVEDLAARILLRLRPALNARWVEVTWLDGTSRRRLRLTDGGRVHEPAPGETTPGELLHAALGGGGRPGARAGRPSRGVAAVRRLDGNGPLLLARTSRDRRIRSALAEAKVVDALVVPLRHDGREIGRLTVGERLSEATGFRRDDLALAQTLAGHAAVALHDAGLLQRLRHQATHDGLTGLGNRALFEEHLAALEEQDPPEQAPGPESLLAPRTAPGAGWVAVLLLDVNRFKDVNDTLGHSAGDQLLAVVAERLRQTLPQAVLIARLGGDEFAVLLDRVGDPADAQAAAASAVAALREPVFLDEITVSADACVGVAVARVRDGAVADMLRQADLAMYAGKSAGRPVTAYSRELERGQAERLALVADLQLALARHELQVAYQPKLDLRDGGLRAVEALVRWEHPRLGPLAPDVFIPLAESTGLIHEMTRQVLASALEQVRDWNAAGLPVGVAVNLSARNLDPQLPETVSAALARTGVPPRMLTLEITESTVMGNPAQTLPVLRRLSDLGVTLSLDDFGTGYSSLSYLQVLPVQEVKIDKSFVQGLAGEGEGHRSHILVRAILTLAHDLGMRVVAEGVEDGVTLELLARLGCESAQGFHIGRPETPERAAALLRRHARRARPAAAATDGWTGRASGRPPVPRAALGS
jgi:diguanylate cyclase (GGDEF)-like protein